MSKKTILIIIITTIFYSCNSKKSIENLSVIDLKNIQEEIKKREDFKSSEAINLNDTLKSSYKNLEIKDNRFKKSILKEVEKFYKRNNYKTRWIYTQNTTPLLDSYLEVLEYSKNYGLNPENYLFTKLKAIKKRVNSSLLPADSTGFADKQITASFLLFAKHLIEGRIVNLDANNKIWRKKPTDKDEIELLAKVTDNEDLLVAIETLHPRFRVYKRMRKRLEEIITNKNKIEYHQFTLKNLDEFKLGYSNDKILLLRENLEKRGFKTDTLSTQVDSNLVAVIKKFQKTKGIKEDGLPSNKTLYYLNLNLDKEKELLMLNMERIRWLNKDFGKEFIVVNIPEYKLFVYKNDSLSLEMDVIVGSEYNATPIFSDRLEYIEFRPTWTVPQSIIRKEMIPKLKADPTYYSRKGFTIYENNKAVNPSKINWRDKSISKRYFTFVEKPSSKNSLGLVKFIFPNNLSIYLHDTPTDYLFKREDRALSHGCVRVSKPDVLAEFLLKDKPSWSLKKVQDAMYNGKPKNRVFLDKEVFVQLVYITAYIDETDKLRLTNDVYGFDKLQLETLKKYW